MPRAPLAYEDIPLEPFEELPAELWSRECFVDNELVNRVVDAAALEVLASLGVECARVEEVTETPSSAMAERESAIAELAEHAGVVPERLDSFHWFFDWLGDHDRPFAELELGMGETGTLRGTPEFAELAERVAREYPGVAPSVELVSHAMRGYREFLRGGDGQTALFGSGTLGLWKRYFSNHHAINARVNLAGAAAVERALLNRGGPLSILELGGGLGSAAEMLIDRLSKRPGVQIARYGFTDVQPGFLRRGHERLRERFPETTIEPALLDINREFHAQRIQGPFDVVFGVNVLHLAVCLPDVLERIAGVLSNDAILASAEGVRPSPARPIAAEFVFRMLPQFRGVETDPEERPEPGFLSGAHWRQALERAGFEDIEFLPANLEAATVAYPNLAMAAFSARR